MTLKRSRRQQYDDVKVTSERLGLYVRWTRVTELSSSPTNEVTEWAFVSLKPPHNNLGDLNRALYFRAECAAIGRSRGKLSRERRSVRTNMSWQRPITACPVQTK